MRNILLAWAVVGVTPLWAGDDWPQWLGPQRDAVWPETGILDTFPAGGPKLLWRTKINGGYAGPAVSGGYVFVMDYQTKADTKADANPNPPKNALDGRERVLCLDAKTGEERWKHTYESKYKVSYPAGPRCTPTVDGDRVYTLGTMGHLFCLDAKTGKALWSKDFVKDFDATVGLWGCTGHPLVDGKQLIVIPGGKAGVVALDKTTGAELWRAPLSADPGYAPPVIAEVGGVRQLLIWLPEKLHGLDPMTGKERWSVELKPQYGMSIMAPRVSGDYLFAGGIGWKSVLLKFTKGEALPKEVWRGTRETSISPVNMTPFLEGDMIYGVDQPGELRGVDLATGKRLWQTYAPTTGEKNASSGTAFVVKNADRFFLFGETGRLTLAKLTRGGYEELGAAKILDPTTPAFGREVVWSHPAFAQKCIFARNDKEIVCYSLAKE
ncbi:MAG: pyrrolo-quinoline quinone [Planctomycetia bacterium]|nr:pyrrolo-quinoline quinone [Planctomycetia bacterium]